LECGRSVSQVYNQPASLALRSVYACNYRLKYLRVYPLEQFRNQT
jgi:hypothetical protein